MEKTISLTKNYLFKRLYYKGKKAVGSVIVVYSMKNKRGDNRLGITVSKKIGNAVVRNKVRRLIRENYRLMENKLKVGSDICVVARAAANGSDFHLIGKQMEVLFSRNGLMEK